MGIKGLSTFLNKYHARYNETLVIRDTLLVIDGNNLMYFLLTHPRGFNDYLVGGDWVFYSKTVRDFFQHLKNCQITAIVIFDGALELEKFKTKVERFKDTIKNNVHHRMPGNSYTPAAMSTVFREILVEQGIAHYQTEFECDDTLAYISRRLGCPLLSSDSDFYIYPQVQNIPLSAIEFRMSLLKKDKSGKKQKKVHILAAKVLSLKKLCKNEFKFTDLRFLPLAAVIIGNDRIATRTFGNVLNSNSDSKLQRIKHVFEWLGKHGDYNHVLSVILGTLKESERCKLLNLVKSVLENYEGENGERKVWNLLVQDLNLNFDLEPADEDTPEPGLPIELHLNCSLPTYLRQILHNQMLFLQPQVEMSNFPSTHDISFDIIRTTAGILLGEGQITLMTRIKRNVTRLQVATVTELPGFGPIPTIRDVKYRNKGISLFYHLFQLNDAEISFINQWPPVLKFLVMCLVYFFKKAQSWSIMRPMATAILLLYLKPIFRSNQKTTTIVEESILPLADLIRQQTWTNELADFFCRFDKTMIFSRTQPYEISYVYVYSQFQCLLVHSVMLSNLVGNPLRLPKFQHFNSHFIYNVIDQVSQRHQGNTNEFLQVYFGNTKTTNKVLAIFNKFFDIVNQVTGDGVETLLQSQRCSGNQDSEVSEGGSSSEIENEFEDLISNRFSKLKVQ